MSLPHSVPPPPQLSLNWVANSGATHRIDYVAVPCSWDCGPGECSLHIVAPRVNRSVADSCSVAVVDSAGDWEDHFLVALRTTLVIRWAPRGTQWKAEGVDRAAIRDPVCCSKFKRALRSIRSPPWAMSVDEHERFAAIARFARLPGPPLVPLRGTPARSMLMLQHGRSSVTGGLLRLGVARGVPAATRGIVPGRTPDPLWVWAADRSVSASLACHAFGALAAKVAPLDESGDPCAGMWESLRAVLRHSGGVLKGCLKASCDAYLEATAVQLASAQADRAHDLAWVKLRPLTCRGGAKWKGARALPGRVGEDGVAATTAQEVSGVVLRYFAAIEAAEACTVDALADRHGSSCPAIAPGTVRDIDNVCDLVTLRKLFARSKRGKACGIDGVRDDFCAIAPAEMADIFHPLLTKCALRVQEPLAHKCGIAVDLWKGKCKHLYMKWYRSLLLNSVAQKHRYRFMRGRLMVLLGAVFLDSQCGGFQGKGTTLASLGVRGFLAATRACRVSAMALFVDLKSGFYVHCRR